MISLFPFQLKAASTIADRYRLFVTDPERPTKRGYGYLPFFQSLQALTGAGKTVIMAEAVTQMRTVYTIEPIVLWISKAKVVVEQTLASLEEGGKYHHLVDSFTALALRDCTPRLIEDSSSGLLLLTTAATFNTKDKDSSDRRIFSVQQDLGDRSTWDSLIERLDNAGKKRPLIIFYDEGHNLSDQQTDLLLELKSDAIILASATPRLPINLADIVDTIKFNGYADEDLFTAIASTDVVEAELVKREVQLGGYLTSEEVAISAMIDDYEELLSVVSAHNLDFMPKCIYVCETNIPGDEQKPFTARSAPPIRIWRHLVEQCNIDPADIAVYCDLKVVSSQPAPQEFVLFRGGDNDYGNFIAGNYKHIIFNLSLQEGWDDPECYFGYIDKKMGSRIQVEQIIGRVLRQPKATHYPDYRLNTCGFYIHVSAEGVFQEIVNEVQAKLSKDLPAVKITSTGGSTKTVVSQPPLVDMQLPSIGTDSSVADERIADILARVSDYIDSSDTRAPGRYTRTNQQIGRPETENSLEWHEYGEGMTVTVHWLLQRLIEKQYPAAYATCDLDDPRFRRRIQIGSRAALQLEDIANQIVAAFLEYTELAVTPGISQYVSAVSVDITNSVPFNNALHPAYSGLNPDELICAKALDRLGWPWFRNPENGGFKLPLLTPGRNRGFYPDFVIWTDNVIWLVDPKGRHLIKDAAGRKLIAIENDPIQMQVKVCLITQGKWNDRFDEISADGVSAWRLRGGSVNRPQWYRDIDELLVKIVGSKPVS